MITTVLATGLVAFAAGHIVENGETTAAKIGASLQSPGMARASVMPGVPTLPRPPVETLQATSLPTTNGWGTALPDSTPLTTLNHSEYGVTLGQTCDATFRAQAIEGGMVRVNLLSPCSIDEPVKLSHAGLSFTASTNQVGRMTVDLPAFTMDARVEAVMPNGQTFISETYVPEAADYHRVAVIWRGDSGLHIHAQEFGAELGSQGHVWAGAPGLDGDAQSGHLKIYGDRVVANATRAEVYTFPTGYSQASGVVDLSIRAEISNTNCGGVIAAQTLQPDGLGSSVSNDLTLRLPECDRIGEQFVLDNVLQDIELASN